MFDVKAAFARLRDKVLTFEELLAEIAIMRKENLSEFSPEIKNRDVLEVAMRHEFVSEDNSGKWHIAA